MTIRQLSAFDKRLQSLGEVGQNILQTLVPAVHVAPARPSPAGDTRPGSLTLAEQHQAGALMRVNHVGEVCAQALYQGQMLGARTPEVHRALAQAARDEQDHLAWCADRLGALKSRPSLLNPVWYAGAFALGFAAAKAGDAISLGFVVETEKQVEAHLASHLERLPLADTASRAVVAQMQRDEAEHGNHAQSLGAAALPAPIKLAMRASAKLMTTLAHYV
jgi:3-demethoxyubiquinol 3-hydroxylase